MWMPRFAAHAKVTADVLGTVIAANDQWLAAPFDNPVERSDHSLGRQREVDLDAESFAVVVVDHIEQTDAAAIGELVVHEVELGAPLVERGVADAMLAAQFRDR